MNLSLKTKLSIWIAIIIILIGAVRTYYFISETHRGIEKKLVARGETLGHSLARAAEEGLASENLDLIKKAEYIVHGEDVIFVQVYSTIWDAIDAYPLERLRDSPLPEAISHFKYSNHSFYKKTNDAYDFYNAILSKPAEDSPEISIGFVRLTVSSSAMHEEIKKTLVGNIVSSVISTVIILIALNILINRLVIGPLSILRRSIKAFKSGGGHDIVPVHSNDEIGGLISSFNRMAETITKDAVELSKSENVLRLSEEKFSKAFRSGPTLMAMSTIEEGRFIDVNDAFLHTFGYEKDEVIGRTSAELGIWADPEERRKILDRLGKSEMIKNEEIVFCKKTREELTMLWSVEVIDIEGRQCILAVAQDITERKKLEARLLQAQKMESIGQLAGGIAHDFNNILTAIIGYAYIVKTKMAEDDPSKDNLDQILNSSNRAANLVRSLLAFSRQQISNPVPVNINEIIKDLVKMLLRVLGENIELTLALSGDLTVMADRVQIDQVIINLCTNARDSMPDGGTLTIRTGHARLEKEFTNLYGYGKPGEYAFISVSDTGTGIDEKLKDKIFEPFFTTKEVGKGTGLGLSIVYGIIKQHNGYITCFSEAGEGTTFTSYLPMIKPGIEENNPEEFPDTGRATETVLLAEDEEDVRKLTSQVLSGAGYRVIEAVDGEDAVDKFISNRDKVDILLLDMIMPKMNGQDVYIKAKELKPDIKALFVSGYPADFIRKKNIIQDGTNYISKPLPPGELLKKIRETLGK
ncbi:MAG: PAS domain S-box protein [Nitrospirae bacterium]|nr:PAS domain S-box protein [Nitrospirota bacterium]